MLMPAAMARAHSPVRVPKSRAFSRSRRTAQLMA